MSDILERILATKRVEVEQARAARPLAAVRADAERRGDPRDFVGACAASWRPDNPPSSPR